MSLKWIAALVAPADVSPHPNFPPSEVQAEELFGLLMQARFVDHDRIVNQEDEPGLPPPTRARPSISASPAEIDVLAACRQGFESSDANRNLDHLVDLLRKRTLDPVGEVAVTLLTSTLLAELDRHHEAVSLVGDLLGRTGGDLEGGFPRAIALQHLALRKLETGETGLQESREATALLRKMRLKDVEPFRLSAGVSWSYKKTIASMRQELLAAAQSHQVRAEPLDGSGWQKIVRSEPPLLSLRTSVRGLRGYQEAAKAAFRDEFHAGGETVFMDDPVDPPMYSAVLHYDVIGHSGEVFGWRTQLGIQRATPFFVGASLEWHAREVIRLLRQADNLQLLELAVRNIRAGGPLMSLLGDAEQIARAKIKSKSFSTVELVVLAGSAQLLPEALAEELFDAISTAIRTGATSTSLRWEIESSRLEKALVAVSAIAGTINKSSAMARLLLEVAQDTTSEDPFMEQALVRIADGLDWVNVSTDVMEAWREWLTGGDSNLHISIAAEISDSLTLPSEAEEPSLPLSRKGIAEIINRHLVSKESIPESLKGPLVEAMMTSMSRVREDAAQHTFVMGGGPVAELGLAVAHITNDEELWAALAIFLMDPRVARHDKSLAFDRIAEGHWPASRQFVSELRAHWHELLFSSEPSMMETTINPYPSLLRAAIALGLPSSEEITDLLTRLSGGEATARVEAARTARVIGRNTNWQWITHVALHLSQDRDHVVRAEAGRALTALLGSSQDLTELVHKRVLELLREDGLLIPTLLLRGLEETNAKLPSAISGEISRIGQDHLAFGVRLLARSVLESSKD